MSDEFYMSLAINKAWQYQILTYPNPAVGCVVLDKFGKILSCEAHKKAGYLHAEPSAIFSALCVLSDNFSDKFITKYNAEFQTTFKNADELSEVLLEPSFTYKFILDNHDDLLCGAKAYVTLEPCSHHGRTPPCAKLFLALKFSEVIIAHKDTNKIASGGAKILKNAGVSVKIGVCKDEAALLLEPFLSWQRSYFSFLKVALSKNGAFNGAISNAKSRTHLHKIRDVIELLIIGGNTVRTDRPTLDTRLISDGKAPDVMIYSRKNEGKFDKNLPLFNVPNRKVRVSKTLENDKKLVMYEGANEFLSLFAKGELNTKWLLLYQSSNFNDAPNIHIKLNLKRIFSGNFGDDSYTWYKLSE
ncbi:bifunctional diaminohydroxyphosphoribosylaminopyrimidine deaminase/5-amino-6-(5-phosphoribosylamino)uracil reductase RibD [Campylobacter sp. faydin G-105]|uniref:bifunctional diaminohydroxyphosphoribosylaminopyrimidine deaminase/5-amino-6-(5-phosphoribosylamino)uracil reductase RibD n=1 Tax=Campylobacter anatolicus TaxID=2829105 RepID=UPI001B9DC567|nr:bifunctional diaminohydroxyphosphoribosylaminopyrimidine deaminase/5-amino-6-(5-phosphoribosylamino)uracil reductase RibD [Campylobacter anatolicus]MBR8461913.1 bifunctional diaminohydroxyphosphoribosylaminopyrimidine deaminase/5-amino-6-(5-phosphoribosylamino)uracil reductase RibD [Campylobacter anatolicus]